MNLFDFFRKPPSKDIAKDRLKLVLVHDRTNCSSELLEMLKNDILQVISKYIVIDKNDFAIQISQSPSSTSNNNEITSTLCANIPIKEIRKITS